MKMSVNGFHDAIKRGDLDVIRIQIEQEGFEPNASMTLYWGIFPDPYTRGYRPLHWAARYGQSNIVEYLLSQGAVIDQANWGGNTPLHLAIYYNLEIASLLIQKGANVDIPNTKVLGLSEYDCTPLHYAARWGNAAIIELILAKSTCFIDAKDYTGKTSLQQIIERAFGSFENDTIFTYRDKLTLVSLLLKLGANIVVQDDATGDTVLHKAIQQVSVDAPSIPANMDVMAMIKLILNSARERGEERLMCLLSTCNNQNCTPLAQSVACNQPIVGSLLHYVYGATLENESNEVQQVMAKCVSPQEFRQVIEQGQLEVLSCYVERKGFDVNADMTTYAWGAPNFFTKEYRPLHWAARYGQFAIVKYLLNQGAAINQANWGGNTPLHLAIYHGYLDIAAFLIQEGADVTLKNVRVALGFSNPEYGCTPLHYAVCRGSVDIVQRILESNHNAINLKDYTRKTPLQQAVERTLELCEGSALLTYKGKQALVRVLIQYMADTNIRYDATGDTVLHMAIKQIDNDACFLNENDDPTALIRLILDETRQQNEERLTALFNTRNKRGLTPLSLAIARDNVPLALLLHMVYETLLENEPIEVQEAINKFRNTMGHIIITKPKQSQALSDPTPVSPVLTLPLDPIPPVSVPTEIPAPPPPPPPLLRLPSQSIKLKLAEGGLTATNFNLPLPSSPQQKTCVDIDILMKAMRAAIEKRRANIKSDSDEETLNIQSEEDTQRSESSRFMPR